VPTAKAAFEITGWDNRDIDDPKDGPELAHATVLKKFTGEVNGTSSAQFMSAGDDIGRGYVTIERFEGEVQGRSGSFSFQHGGVMSGEDVVHQFGVIIPGSGREGLSGIYGTALLTHDDQGARFTLEYELAPPG
jgi:hypothetical protein